jgi:putative inorganic carbon (hco3(-)) transporter
MSDRAMRGNLVQTVLKKTLIFIDRLYWLWLVLAAPFMLFPSPKRSLVMLIVPLQFILQWAVHRSEHKAGVKDGMGPNKVRASGLPVTPLNGALLLFSVMILVSLWATYNIQVSLPKISGLMLGIGVFFAIVRASQQEKGWLISLLATMGLGVGISVLGALGTNWVMSKFNVLNPFIASLPRIIFKLQGAESGIHPNEVAGALTWILPLMIALSLVLIGTQIHWGNRKKTEQAIQLNEEKNNPAVGVKNRRPRVSRGFLIILIYLATIFIMAVFFFTQSRGGYIGLFVTLLGSLILSLPARWRWLGLSGFMLLFFILGFLALNNGDTFSAWILGNNLASASTFSLNSLPSRVEIWSRAVYGIEDFPLTGMGLNTFRNLVGILYPLFTIPADVEIGHAHNEFLQAALDLGIPGLIAFLGLYLGAFQMLFAIWKAELKSLPSDPIVNYFDLSACSFRKAMVLGLGGGLMAHLLFGLTDAVALGAKPGLLFWMLLALICGLYLRTIRKQADPINRSEMKAA